MPLPTPYRPGSLLPGLGENEPPAAAAPPEAEPARGKWWLLPRPSLWKRLPSLLRGLAVAAVGFEAIYLTGANGLFAAKKLEKWISNDEGTFILRYDGLTTPFPGRYHVTGLQIQSQGEHVQWRLEVGDAWFTCNPLVLLQHKFSVSRVDGDGVTFRLRIARPPEERNDPENAALPPLPGFDDPPTPLPPEAEPLRGLRQGDGRAQLRRSGRREPLF